MQEGRKVGGLIKRQHMIIKYRKNIKTNKDSLENNNTLE